MFNARVATLKKSGSQPQGMKNLYIWSKRKTKKKDIHIIGLVHKRKAKDKHERTRVALLNTAGNSK